MTEIPLLGEPAQGGPTGPLDGLVTAAGRGQDVAAARGEAALTPDSFRVELVAAVPAL